MQITYEQHLAWLDKQVLQAQATLDEIIAERHGFLEAKRNASMMDYYSQSRLVERYRMGWQIGKTKLLLEEGSCGKNRCDSSRAT